jgi:hypothetical protein
MNTNRIRLAATMFLLAAGSLFVLAANAEDAQAPGAMDAGAGDAGTADANTDAGPPPLPAFDALPFAEEKSPKPNKEEWKDAQEVALSEGTLIGSFCKSYRLREWIRIRCDHTTTAQMVVRCGNPEDVFMVLDRLPDEWATFPEGGEIVFPLRRGDRRLIEWTSVDFGYKGASSALPWMLISETWLPGEDKPTVIAR